MTGAGDGPSADERAAFRAFVREHHPDRGGDPEAFAAGLTRFRAPGRAGQGTSGCGGTGPQPRTDRYDAPVELVAPLPLPLRGVLHLMRRWRRRHRPRVD